MRRGLRNQTFFLKANSAFAPFFKNTFYPSILLPLPTLNFSINVYYGQRQKIHSV